MFSIRAPRVDREVELRGELLRRAAWRWAKSRTMPAFVGSVARTMFSATVITGMSMKCWCTIPIPRSIASFGESIRTRSPLIEDLALVRVVEPVEDAHERRLAGAVLAEQRVHLAVAQVEVDVVVREHARKLLRDPVELEDDGRLAHRARDSSGRLGRRPVSGRRRGWRRSAAAARSRPP